MRLKAGLSGIIIWSNPQKGKLSPPAMTTSGSAAQTLLASE
jgi:hypothetical protein